MKKPYLRRCMLRISAFFIRVFIFLLITTSVFAATQDEILAKKVHDAIILTPNLFDGFLKVSAQNRVVYLNGRVLSEKDKSMAMSITRGVIGVVDVVANLEVRPLGPEDAAALQGMQGRGVIEPVSPSAYGKLPASPASAPSRVKSSMQRMREEQDRADEDNRIRRDVEFAIQMEAGMPRVQGVYVTVTDGVVTLNGIIDDRYLRWQIESAVRRVRGVKRVSDQLLIR